MPTIPMPPCGRYPEAPWKLQPLPIPFNPTRGSVHHAGGRPERWKALPWHLAKTRTRTPRVRSRSESDFPKLQLIHWTRKIPSGKSCPAYLLPRPSSIRQVYQMVLKGIFVSTFSFILILMISFCFILLVINFHNCQFILPLYNLPVVNLFCVVFFHLFLFKFLSFSLFVNLFHFFLKRELVIPNC